MAEMIEAEQLRESIGANVARLRNQRGWSQQDLAARVGITSIHVSRIENGHYSPKAELLYTLADVLGVPTDRLRQACEKAAAR